MERERIYRIVESRGLASFANNSRWNRFFDALAGFSLTARLKNVAWAEASAWSRWLIPTTNYVEVLAAGPVHFREIEWIEFDCHQSEPALQNCLGAARDANLPFEVLNATIRVFGYRSTGANV